MRTVVLKRSEPIQFDILSSNLPNGVANGHVVFEVLRHELSGRLRMLIYLEQEGVPFLPMHSGIATVMQLVHDVDYFDSLAHIGGTSLGFITFPTERSEGV